MDLSPTPGLAYMAWRVQQVSGNPPWQCCVYVRARGQMVPGWAETSDRTGFPRWAAADLRCGSGPRAGVLGAPSAQLTSAGCRVSHWKGGGGVSRTNGHLRKGGLVIPGDRLCPPAPWSAAGSVQHVCRESSLLNTFHLTQQQQSSCLPSLTLNPSLHSNRCLLQSFSPVY